MIIKRITMHNFGVYASTNTFEFNGKKPIVLIGGLNGRGKTTFLEAVLLSLYGANSFAYQESSFDTYGQYLRSYVNTSDGSKKTFVEIEIVLNNTAHDKFLIRREWNALGKVRTVEKIRVMKNGEYDEFLTMNWSMYVENILPSALSIFFFFDGEKIAELAVDNTGTRLKESIKAMLGISVLDTLNTDLLRNIRKLQKSINASFIEEDIEKLRKYRDDAEAVLQDIQNEIKEKQELLKEYEAEKEHKEQEYLASGGELTKKREALFTEKEEVQDKISQNSDKLMSLVAGELPLSLVRDLLEKIAEQSEKEHLESEKKSAEKYIDILFAKYQQINGQSSQIREFIEYIKSEGKKEEILPVYQLSDHDRILSRELSDTGIRHRTDEANGILDNQEKLQKKLWDIENYLSIEIDEDKLKEIGGEISVLEQKISECKARLVALEQSRSSANGTFMRASSEFNKEISRLLDGLETNDDDQRALKYSEMAVRVLKEFSLRLQVRKIGALGETITDCYKRLADKKNMIDKITMDPVTLDLKYLNNEGEAVEKTTLSAGEKQMMVISILWALAICSRKKLPVIIDTPLSRLDSNHRKALIQNYFPNASDQTIILSTDSELTGQYYDLLKDNVGNEFTLNYDDQTKSTTIETGYFQEVI